MCRLVVQCLSLYCFLVWFGVHAGKLEQVTNFRPTIVGGTAKHCIDQYIVLFRYCSLGGNTAMPGGLHAIALPRISSCTWNHVFITPISETRANAGLGNCCAWWTQCRISAHAEIARHASRLMLSQCKTPHFSVTSGLPQWKSWLQDIAVQVCFRLQVGLP